MKEKPKSAVALVSEPGGGHRPPEGSDTKGKVIKFWAKHKIEAVMQLLRGETLDALSRELGVSAAQLSQWRDDFLEGGAQRLSSRQSKDDTECKRLKEKIGELTMTNELLNEKINRMEQNRPLARRRLKK